jgi:hypothetical protein
VAASRAEGGDLQVMLKRGNWNSVLPSAQEIPRRSASSGGSGGRERYSRAHLSLLLPVDHACVMATFPLLTAAFEAEAIVFLLSEEKRLG